MFISLIHEKLIKPILNLYHTGHKEGVYYYSDFKIEEMEEISDFNGLTSKEAFKKYRGTCFKRLSDGVSTWDFIYYLHNKKLYVWQIDHDICIKGYVKTI